MYVLIFDTETNGLPKSFNASPMDINNWPNILSIGWELWDMFYNTSGIFEYKRIDKQERYISFNDDKYKWNEETESIHGITRDYLKLHGEPGKIVCADFIEVLKLSDVIVAHNISFDKSVFIAETYRNIPETRIINWWPRMEYCTCKNTIDLCKLPFSPPKKTGVYKMPKLIELYISLFGSDKAGEYKFHTAADDVRCLTDCFIELVKREHVPLKLWKPRQSSN